MTVGALEVLLIEDNPGDARLVEELLRKRQDLLHRIAVDGRAPERIELQHESELSAGLASLEDNAVDVVLLDLGLPDSQGLETLSTAVEETQFTPVIVLTGLDDRDRGIQAIQSGAQDYLVKDEVTGELLIHSIQYAIEQTRQQRERVRYREQLEALNKLNTITQEVTHDVITTSSREDLEQAVCERLVDSAVYPCAWIGEVNRRTGELSPRVIAGVDGLEGLTISVDEARPEATAAETRDVSVAQQTDLAHESVIRNCSLGSPCSVAAIPVSYQSILYGILVIYAESPTAFSDHETEVLSRLGDVIGHAITSVERKDALASDTALQLEFRLDGVAEELVSLSAEQGSVELEDVIRRDSGLLVYGVTTAISHEQFEEAANRSDVVEQLRLLGSGTDQYKFECLTTAADALDNELLTHGGRIDSATIENGEFRLVIEFPQIRDKRKLVELVETNCPGATLYAHRTVERDTPTVSESRSVFKNRLTEKQRAVLEAAYHAGYFKWPRTTSGGELAERLGVTQATFSQHFRAAEREFFSAVFEDEDDQLSSPWESSETD